MWKTFTHVITKSDALWINGGTRQVPHGKFVSPRNSRCCRTLGWSCSLLLCPLRVALPGSRRWVLAHWEVWVGFGIQHLDDSYFIWYLIVVFAFFDYDFLQTCLLNSLGSQTENQELLLPLPCIWYFFFFLRQEASLLVYSDFCHLSSV